MICSYSLRNIRAPTATRGEKLADLSELNIYLWQRIHSLYLFFSLKRHSFTVYRNQSTHMHVQVGKSLQLTSC